MSSNHKSRQKPVINSGYSINEFIKSDQLRVISADGENLGVLSKQEALTLAENSSLDLVQISESGDNTVARVMNFGKFLYEKKKQQHEAKKHQKVIQVKELKMRPNIGIGDYKVRLNKAIEFLKSGKRVKFTLQFRGREAITMHDVGPKLFKRVKVDLENEKLGTIMEEQESRGSPFWSKIFFIKQ
ncbi:translation initiation factor IF-3 [Candidatus Dependentiae bacterium]|nr:MAG: translation initiation factor IF-3 [Candidatus Dependentiae bacterium]